MISEYRYSLEKGSKKYHCPRCDEKTFVRFKDNYINEYLPEQYGRCDRSNKCQYNVSPYKDGYINDQNSDNSKFTYKTKSIFESKTPVYFNQHIFSKTLEKEGFVKNTFIQNLLKNVPFPFDQDVVYKVAELYKLGTIIKGNMARSITFPFIDIKNNLRAIQVKQFDNKNHTIRTDFLHTIIKRHYNSNSLQIPDWLNSYLGNEKIITCLFGEHLLEKFPDNPVALVEAPKTAIYGTLYFGLPNAKEDLIWLAVYSKDTFTFDKLKVLRNRNVIVFPDLSKDGSTYNGWKEKASRFALKIPGVRFHFSDLLEKEATEEEKNKGFDLADFLISQDWKLFRS